MSEKTVGQIMERPPMYWDAVAYCERNGLSRDDVEQARTMLAVRELQRRVEPYQRATANLLAMEKPGWITSEGYVRAALSPEMNAALKLVEVRFNEEAESLGLAVPARDR